MKRRHTHMCSFSISLWFKKPDSWSQSLAEKMEPGSTKHMGYWETTKWGEKKGKRRKGGKEGGGERGKKGGMRRGCVEEVTRGREKEKRKGHLTKQKPLCGLQGTICWAYSRTEILHKSLLTSKKNDPHFMSFVRLGTTCVCPSFH